MLIVAYSIEVQMNHFKNQIAFFWSAEKQIILTLSLWLFVFFRHIPVEGSSSLRNSSKVHVWSAEENEKKRDLHTILNYLHLLEIVPMIWIYIYFGLICIFDLILYKIVTRARFLRKVSRT